MKPNVKVGEKIFRGDDEAVVVRLCIDHRFKAETYVKMVVAYSEKTGWWFLRRPSYDRVIPFMSINL